MLLSPFLSPKTKALPLAWWSLERGDAGGPQKPPLFCPKRPLTKNAFPLIRGAVLAQSEGSRMGPGALGVWGPRAAPWLPPQWGCLLQCHPPTTSTAVYPRAVWQGLAPATSGFSAGLSSKPPPKSKHSQEAPAQPETRTVGGGGMGVASQGTVLGVGVTEKHRGV